MSERSTGPSNVFDEDVDRVWIKTSEGSLVVDPSTWIATVKKIPPKMETRFKNDGFYKILKEKGATGALDYLEGLKEEGFIEWLYVAIGQHRHLFGRDAQWNPFSVDLDDSE